MKVTYLETKDNTITFEFYIEDNIGGDVWFVNKWDHDLQFGKSGLSIETAGEVTTAIRRYKDSSTISAYEVLKISTNAFKSEKKEVTLINVTGNKDIINKFKLIEKLGPTRYKKYMYLSQEI